VTPIVRSLMRFKADATRSEVADGGGPTNSAANKCAKIRMKNMNNNKNNNNKPSDNENNNNNNDDDDIDDIDDDGDNRE
jgi:hypothetical protein